MDPHACGFAAALPTKGEHSRLGTALRRSWTPTLAASPLRCPQRGSIRALGRPCGAHGPHACGLAAALPPKGEHSRLGTALRRSWTPHACGLAAALPPKGEYSRLGTALRRSWIPTLAASPLRCPQRGSIRALGRPCGAHGPRQRRHAPGKRSAAAPGVGGASPKCRYDNAVAILPREVRCKNPC